VFALPQLCYAGLADPSECLVSRHHELRRSTTAV
jgi:hypothetical protein